MFLGLRTIIYPAADLARSKSWYTSLLGIEPYFDEPFYVGFNVAGYELALDPNADASLGSILYWGVSNADDTLAQLLNAGAQAREAVRDVGADIRVATVTDIGGSILGIIENPHFQLPDPPPSSGPGK